jgi:hypothetical protein
MGYLLSMFRLARILLVALLAVFAASGVVHAASATTMAVKMALADGDAMDMADCDGCGSGDAGNKSGPPCDMVCIAPFVATVNAETALAFPMSATAVDWASRDFAGRTGPPDPYPPRNLSLS